MMSKIFHYILLTTQKYGIDESHGLSHSMNVLAFARDIYKSEINEYPILKDHQNIIYSAALLHDMCDKKYVVESIGLDEMEQYLMSNNVHVPKPRYFGYDIAGPYINEVKHEMKLEKVQDLTPNEMTVIKQIISTMSYSKVKIHGYPDLGPYQRAYHIVREADLLAAYDFDRCMIYDMKRNGKDVVNSFKHADQLFNDRVLIHNDDGLFLTNYSKVLSKQLHKQALGRIKVWRDLVM